MSCTMPARRSSISTEADCPDPNVWFEPEFAVLLNEFKHDVAAYMKPLKHTKVRTLADLIAFDIEHCEEEMRYFGRNCSKRPRRRPVI